MKYSNYQGFSNIECFKVFLRFQVIGYIKRSRVSSVLPELRRMSAENVNKITDHTISNRNGE